MRRDNYVIARVYLYNVYFTYKFKKKTKKYLLILILSKIVNSKVRIDYDEF